MSTTASAPIPIDRTLGDLVAEVPARARVFERLGLDYCCRGNRTVAEAALAQHLDPEFVARELAAATDAAGADIDALEPVALVDHILETHHAYLHEELPLLVALAAKVDSVHGDRHPELERVAALVIEIQGDLDPHMAKEELVLFPAVPSWSDGERTFPFGSLANPVGVMMQEHAHIGGLLDEMRHVTDGYTAPMDACTSYRVLYERMAILEADTHRHVHLENNVLFPAITATP